MKNFTRLSQFRSLFEMGITKEESLRIWGETYSPVLKKSENRYVTEKKKIAEMDKSPNFAPSKSAKNSVFNKFRKMFD